MTTTQVVDYAIWLQPPMVASQSALSARKATGGVTIASRGRRHQRSMSSVSAQTRRTNRPGTIRLPDQSSYLNQLSTETSTMSSTAGHFGPHHRPAHSASTAVDADVAGYFDLPVSSHELSRKSSLATPPLLSTFSGYEQPMFSRSKSVRLDRSVLGDKCINVSLVVRDGVAEVQSEHVDLDVETLGIRSRQNSTVCRNDERSPAMGTFMPSPSLGHYDEIAAASIGGLNRTVSSAGSDASISRGFGTLSFVQNARGQAMMRSISHSSDICLSGLARSHSREHSRSYRQCSADSTVSTSSGALASRSLAEACYRRSPSTMRLFPSSSDTAGQSPMSTTRDNDTDSATDVEPSCFGEDDFVVRVNGSKLAAAADRLLVVDENVLLDDTDSASESSDDDDDDSDGDIEELQRSLQPDDADDDAQAVVRKLFDRQRLKHGSGASYLDSVSSLPQPSSDSLDARSTGMGLIEDCMLNNVPPTPLSKRSTTRAHPLGCERCGIIFRSRSALKKHELDDGCGVRLPAFRASDFYDVGQDDGYPSSVAAHTHTDGLAGDIQESYLDAFAASGKEDTGVDEDVLLGDMLF